MEKKEFDTRLISAVESWPIIYNRQLSESRLCLKKERAWEEIAIVLNKTSIECKKRWRTLRDTFAAHLKSQKGSGSSRSCKWAYYNSLLFLRHNVKEPKSQHNYKTQDSVSDIETLDFDFVEVHGHIKEEVDTTPPIKKRRRTGGKKPSATLLSAVDKMAGKCKQTPTESFLYSIAHRVDALSTYKKSLFQMKVLKLIHDMEFDEPNEESF